MGKRKRAAPLKEILGKGSGVPDTSTEEEEVVKPVRRRSRSQRVQAYFASEEEELCRKGMRIKEKRMIPLTVGRDARTGQFVSTQPCSKREGKVNLKEKDKLPKRKKGPDKPTIEEMLHWCPVPGQLEELEDAPAAQSTASAKEWLEDIEIIRRRSSYQGVLSRRIKERLAALNKVPPE